MNAAEPSRIAFVLPDMRGGGAERVALEVITHLQQAGHPVDLVLQQAGGELLPLVPEGIRVIDLKAQRLRNVVRPLARYLLSEQPRAVQVSMWPLTIVAIAAHRLARSRARLVVSDHIVLSRQYADGGALHHAAMKATLGLFYPMADARIAVSSGAADDLSSLSGIDRGRISVVYNPLPAPAVAPASPAQTRQIWGDAPGPRILTVGSLKAQKNQSLLLRAFARLLREQNATLAILGEGPLGEDLRREAQMLGLEGAVRFPGFLSDPGPAYASADLFVLSSDYEGFGNVIVEALHWGVPVVSTDCPSGPAEILEGGTYGTLVPCRDEEALARAMAQALREPVDKEALKQRARALSGESAIADYFRLLGLTPETNLA